MSAQFQSLHRLVVTVATAATPVQVNGGTALYVRSFIAQAHLQNSGNILIGDSSANSLIANAHALSAGGSLALSGDTLAARAVQFDLSQLWVNSDGNAQKLIITYMLEVLHQ